MGYFASTGYLCFMVMPAFTLVGIAIMLGLLVGVGVVAFLIVRGLRSQSQVRPLSAEAKVIGRRPGYGQLPPGSQLVGFALADGQVVELALPGPEAAALDPGDKGVLARHGGQFIGFAKYR
jgi:hypothetical protein